VLCLSISVQRATFIVIDKVTGEPMCQLISWSDRRASGIVDKVNKSLAVKLIKGGASVLYWLTHKNRFKQGSNFRLQYNFVSGQQAETLTALLTLSLFRADSATFVALIAKQPEIERRNASGPCSAVHHGHMAAESTEKLQ
jgi:hypothetical protein